MQRKRAGTISASTNRKYNHRARWKTLRCIFLAQRKSKNKANAGGAKVADVMLLILCSKPTTLLEQAVQQCVAYFEQVEKELSATNTAVTLPECSSNEYHNKKAKRPQEKQKSK
jgi:hypothetical protein